MSGTEIKLKPFSLKFLYPLRGIGWIILVLGMSMIEYSARKKGADDYFKKTEKQVQEIKDIQAVANKNLKESADILLKATEKVSKENQKNQDEKKSR